MGVVRLRRAKDLGARARGQDGREADSEGSRIPVDVAQAWKGAYGRSGQGHQPQDSGLAKGRGRRVLVPVGLPQDVSSPNHYAAHGDADWTKEIAGHEEKSNLFVQRYKGVIAHRENGELPADSGERAGVSGDESTRGASELGRPRQRSLLGMKPIDPSGRNLIRKAQGARKGLVFSAATDFAFEAL